MIDLRRSLYSLSIAAGVLGMAVVSSVGLYGQSASTQPVGVPDDWSHHHVVFSDPGTAADALAQGRINQWYKVTNDPRYRMQQMKHSLAQRELSAAPTFAAIAAQLSARSQSTQAIYVGPTAIKRQKLKRDWSMNMGAIAASQTGTVTSNGAKGSSTITVAGQVLNASAPAAETAKIVVGSTIPAGGSNVQIGTIIYNFVNASTISVPGANNCNIRSFSTDTQTTVATNLDHAITNGGVASNTTWQCGTGATPNAAVTAGTFTSPTINLTAVTPGSTGFTFSSSGTLNFTTFTTTPGTDGTTDGTHFAYWSGSTAVSTTQLATNLATAINANTTLGKIGGVSATSSSNVVTVIANTAGASGNSITLSASLTGFAWAGSPLSGGAGGGGTVGAGIYPAKYSFAGTTAYCDNAATPDFVVYNTGLAGSATEPTIVAYDNLYSGCPTTSVPVPNVYWQYYTGGTILTNISLSADGKQVAFVQTNGSSQAQLVMLKWSPDIAINSLTSQASAAAYATCTAPCMYAITFSQTKPSGGALSTPNDTNSSPFYDFAHDTIYVGEDNGWVHKFSPVFNGAPAEVITSGWPILASAAPVSSPVYDFNSTLVFVGPATGANGASGRLHSITTTGTATVINSGSMAASGSATTYMYADGPIVDSSAETVYAFANADVSASPGLAAVWQIPYNFGAGATGTEVTVGQGNSANPMYSGAFDNIYMSAAGPVGNLYVCGRAAGSQAPTLYRIPINTTMGTPVAIDTLATAATNCSPVTEFYNTSTSTDYIFLSVNGSSQTASPVACPSNTVGCVMSFNVTSAIGAGAYTTATLQITGGTSGIAIDNAVGAGTLAGASQVYFSPLGSQNCGGNSNASAGVGTGGCAVQASQAGLQ